MSQPLLLPYHGKTYTCIAIHAKPGEMIYFLEPVLLIIFTLFSQSKDSGFVTGILKKCKGNKIWSLHCYSKRHVSRWFCEWHHLLCWDYGSCNFDLVHSRMELQAARRASCFLCRKQEGGNCEGEEECREESE